MNQNGQLRESDNRCIGLAGEIGTLVAVAHHAGSWTNSTFYIHNNHRGDIVLTRSGTATVGSYAYSAFGTLHSTLGHDLCRFKFSSKERDASTWFSYYGYRFYSPQWQRWVSRDPITERGGVNLYGFLANVPVSRTDIVGLWFSEEWYHRKPARPNPALQAAKDWLKNVCRGFVRALSGLTIR